MTILKVAQVGYPSLRARALPVDADPVSLAQAAKLLDDMTATMREYGGVGLAAPQIRVSLRAFVMEVEDSERYPERQELPLVQILNPRITPISDERELGWEGCLSISGLFGQVERPQAVRLEGLGRAGDPIDMTLTGFAAVVAQHETDHLDGVVFLDRMTDMSSIMAEEEYRRMRARDAEPSATHDRDRGGSR